MMKEPHFESVGLGEASAERRTTRKRQRKISTGRQWTDAEYRVWATEAVGWFTGNNFGFKEQLRIKAFVDTPHVRIALKEITGYDIHPGPILTAIFPFYALTETYAKRAETAWRTFLRNRNVIARRLLACAVQIKPAAERFERVQTRRRSATDPVELFDRLCRALVPAEEQVELHVAAVRLREIAEALLNDDAKE